MAYYRYGSFIYYQKTISVENSIFEISLDTYEMFLKRIFLDFGHFVQFSKTIRHVSRRKYYDFAFRINVTQTRSRLVEQYLFFFFFFQATLVKNA